MSDHGDWPPPGFPLVEGEHAMTRSWSIFLPEQFTRRIEEGSLVLWRPGLTVWIDIWNNDHNEPQAQRLAAIKDRLTPQRRDEREAIAGGLTRWSCRINDTTDRGATEAVTGAIFSDGGEVSMIVYFDSERDAGVAQRLIDSVSLRNEEG